MEIITRMRWVLPVCGENIRVLEIKTGKVYASSTVGTLSLISESDWKHIPIEIISDEEFSEKGYFE